jgi:triphosphatase
VTFEAPKTKARASVGEQLSESAPQGLPGALSVLLARQLKRYEQAHPGLVHGAGADFGHAARVAIRRSRALLRLARGLKLEKEARWLNAELRWLAGEIGVARDLMVIRQDLAPSAESRAIKALAHAGAEARQRLAETLHGARVARLMERWRAFIADLPLLRAKAALEAVAARRARAMLRDVLKDGAALTSGSHPESFHTLRKDAKKLRYTVELLSAHKETTWLSQSIVALKQLQDWLGHYQDLSVRIDSLGALADAGAGDGPAHPQQRAGLQIAACSAAAERAAMAFGFLAEFATFQRLIALHALDRRLKLLSA